MYYFVKTAIPIIHIIRIYSPWKFIYLLFYAFLQVVELKIIAFFSANEFFQQFIINDIQAHLTGQGIKIT